jgi:hypothetical protein
MTIVVTLPWPVYTLPRPAARADRGSFVLRERAFAVKCSALRPWSR